MKLSSKLTAYAVAIMAAAILICSVLLLYTSAKRQLKNVRDGGIAELKMLVANFHREMEDVWDYHASDTVRRSTTLYVFRKYISLSSTGAQYALYAGDEALYNEGPLNPTLLLTLEAAPYASAQEEINWPVDIVLVEGRQYVVAGNWASGFTGGAEYAHQVYLVRDVTDVYSSITKMALSFLVITLVTIIAAALLTRHSLKRGLRQLKQLQNNATALAEGKYNQRISVVGHDEISILADNFNAMADTLTSHIEKLNDIAEQRKLLIAALTHELKTPMTAIIGYSDTLMGTRLTEADRTKALEYINSECKRLERLSQKMMHLIMLEDGEPADVQPHKVSDLFTAIEYTLVEVATSNNIDLAFSGGDVVLSMDIDMISSIVINLFDNACKSGAQHITIEAIDNKLIVDDDGGGIPADELDRVTQPFYMVNKARSKSEGSIGLGLALASLIVKLHRAHLRISSELGNGTTVEIEFAS